MELRKIRDCAEKACAPLLNDRSIRIRVSAQSGNDKAGDCYEAFREWADKNQPAAAIRTGGMGYEDLEPVVIIDKPGAQTAYYTNVTGETAGRVIESCLKGSGPLPDEVAIGLTAGERMEIPSLHKLQKRLAMCGCGFVDPESIDQAVVLFGGYAGLDKALRMTRPEAADSVGQSGLRERDGEGRPVRTLWEAVRETKSRDKIVVCNALTCVPQLRASRLLLEGDPHAVLEGLLISAYAAGASKAIIAVPAGSAYLCRILEGAFSQMKAYGLLGENILESGFSCDAEVREVPAAPASWEHTALLSFLEGRQAIPYLREKDAVLMSDGRPAIISNAETLSNVSAVFREGPDVFKGIGTEKSAGTKIITLNGDAGHSYTVEVAFGTPIGTVVRDIGGSRSVKAVQFGGPTGGLLEAGVLEKTISYETACEGGEAFCFELLTVIADGACAVATAGELMQRLHGMSCGKCVFCREGTLHLSKLLDDLIKGEGRPGDLELIEELGRNMKNGCICRFGRTAADPVLSSLELFRPEYEYHLKHKTCPAGQKGGAGNGNR